MNPFVVHLWSPDLLTEKLVSAADKNEAKVKAIKLANADHGDHDWQRVAVNTIEEEIIWQGFSS